MSVGNFLSQRAGWAAGQPISELMAQALANPQLISLAAGFVDQESLPVEPTRAALEAIFSDPDAAQAALQYGTTAGYPPLREAILDEFHQSEGLTADETKLSIDQVVVTAGSNQLLHLVSESILDAGDIVLCASPTYLVFMGTLGNLGARSVGVATDQQGIVPEAIEEALQQIEADGELEKVKAIYLLPYFDNPTGIVTETSRREQIVEIAQRWSRQGKIHVIEDAAYRSLRYWGEDTPSTRTFDQQGDTVIVAGTFSKSYSPGLRLGWGILPPSLVDPVCRQKGNIDFGSPNFNQHLMAKVFELDLYQPHVERIRESYRVKCEAMIAAARQYLSPIPGVRWNEPTGGLYLWAQLPEQIATGPSGQLFDAAVEQGVLYVPGEYCYPREGEPVCNNTMRLSFGVQSCEGIRMGIEALARAIERVMD